MTDEPHDLEAARVIARLRHEIALRDQFIRIAAHELRNPISPAYMQLAHIKESVQRASAPIAKDWLLPQLDAVTSRFDRFLEVLNRLLDASRLGEGHLVLLQDHCDLVELTRGVLASAARELRAARCDLELELPAQPVIGWWDAMRLEQIVGNLLSNASRYGAGRPVTIQLTATDDAAELSVRDRGIGIAADDQARIFQRFERARNVGRSTGFGIGLWVVAELCRGMNGAVAVDSVLGEGATFIITLPRRS